MADSPTNPQPTVLTHPSGATYEVGSSAPDDAERMACERAGDLGHAQCGVHPCCGWPRFLVCPDDPRRPSDDRPQSEANLQCHECHKLISGPIIDLDPDGKILLCEECVP